jgi:hypothetical protein
LTATFARKLIAFVFQSRVTSDVKSSVSANGRETTDDGMRLRASDTGVTSAGGATTVGSAAASATSAVGADGNAGGGSGATDVSSIELGALPAGAAAIAEGAVTGGSGPEADIVAGVTGAAGAGADADVGAGSAVTACSVRSVLTSLQPAPATHHSAMSLSLRFARPIILEGPV